MVTRSVNSARQRAAGAGGMVENSNSKSRDTSAVIAMSPPDAPMTSTLFPRSRPARMEELERLAQRSQGIAAGNAGLAAEGLENLVRARQRSGMTARGARRRRRTAGLDHRDGLAGRRAPSRRRAQIARDP